MGWRDRLTKHADWQPLPRRVTNDLPVCPICRKRTEWEVRDRYGWTTRGYRIICRLCGAEWEYTTSKPKDIIIGGAIAALKRVSEMTNDQSVWILQKTGHDPAKPNADVFLDKEITFSTWKQMAGSFCGKCGSPLAEDEKFCAKCGVPRD